MWIVRVALERPYTFIVLALLILIMGPLTILRTPTDIFPNINIPIVGVVWKYTGLLPQEMADRIISNYERAATTTVNDIEHIESQSLNGVSVVKFYFQPTVNIDMAVAQITAISQTVLQTSPPGTTPPLVVAYNASSVPIIQLALTSSTLSETQINDLGQKLYPDIVGDGAGRGVAVSLWWRDAADSGRYRSAQICASMACPPPMSAARSVTRIWSFRPAPRRSGRSNTTSS